MKIEVTFPFDKRDIPKSAGLNWNKKNKTWRGNLTVAGAIILKPHVSGQLLSDIENFLSKFQISNGKNYPLKNAEPMNHQVESANAIKSMKKYGVFHEMGVGKTVTTIMAMQDLWSNGEINHVLILAPLAVVVEWESQVKQFMKIPFDIVRISHPIKKKRIENLETFLNKGTTGLSVGLLNYDSLRTLNNSLMNQPPDMIVADESTRIKNRNAQSTKIATQLSDKAKYSVILTGTPIPNMITDIYSQVRFLSKDYLGNSFWKFVNRYAVKGGWEGRQIVGTQNENELSHVLSHFTSTVKKEDVLELPEQIYSIRNIDLSKEQKKAYKDAQKEFLFAVKAVEAANQNEQDYHVLIKNALARMAFCQRIASGHIKEEFGEQTVRFKDNAKAKALRELVEDAGHQQIIVCARFKEDLQIVEDTLSDIRNVVTYHGGLDSRVADENLSKFKDGSADIFAMQVQKGGYGLNLTNASMMIFYNNWFSYGTRDQAESRIHRKGQENHCLYVDLVANETVDEDIIQSIKNKMSVSESIFGKKVEVEDADLS